MGEEGREAHRRHERGANEAKGKQERMDGIPAMLARGPSMSQIELLAQRPRGAAAGLGQRDLVLPATQVGL